MFEYIQPEPKTAEDWEEFYDWLMDRLEKIGVEAYPKKRLKITMSPDVARDFKTLAYATNQNFIANPEYDTGEEVFHTPFFTMKVRISAEGDHYAHTLSAPYKDLH